MRVISKDYATIGTKDAIGLNARITPMNAAYAIIVPNGVTASLTLEHTYDDLNNPNGVTPVWIASDAITQSTESSFTVPWQFVRLVIASISGGSVTFKVTQGDSIN